MKRLVLFAFILSSVALAVKGLYWRTSGFKLAKVELYELAEGGASIPTHLLQERVFSYLGKGRQCYAFADGDLVLKLIRSDKLEPPFWAIDMFGEREKKSCSARRHSTRESCSLAMALQEETGVFYTHFNKTRECCFVTLLDRWGRPYHLNLARFRFVLQKRATPLGIYVKAIQDEAWLRELIVAYLRVMASRLSKGIENKDLNWATNYGVVDSCQERIQVAEIDIGRLYRVEAMPEHQMDRRLWFTKKLHNDSSGFFAWLKANRPALSFDPEALIAEVIATDIEGSSQ